MRLLVNFLSFLLESKMLSVLHWLRLTTFIPLHTMVRYVFFSHFVTVVVKYVILPYPVSLYTALRVIQPYQDTDLISQELLPKLGEVNTLRIFGFASAAVIVG